MHNIAGESARRILFTTEDVTVYERQTGTQRQIEIDEAGASSTWDIALPQPRRSFARCKLPHTFSLVSPREAATLPEDRSPHLCLKVPSHWWVPVLLSPHAQTASDTILAWFEELGCSREEVEHARRFYIGGYVGRPFPNLSLEHTILVGKYFSLWLLWDDVDVESLQLGWRIDPEDVLAGRRRDHYTRFDEGWWQLLAELARTRSPAYIRRLCAIMTRWSEAAHAEARFKRAYEQSGDVPSFATQLELRVRTIGMYGTSCLLEEFVGQEAPPSFHDHPLVHMLRYLACTIVGLGNDLFSFGKDHAIGQLSLISTLMHDASTSVDFALATLVRMHDDAMLEFDRVAERVLPWAEYEYPAAEQWIRALRTCSLGCTLWASEAPRYTNHQIVSQGRVLRPRFERFSPCPELG